jgi:hypothetical protein
MLSPAYAGQGEGMRGDEPSTLIIEHDPIICDYCLLCDLLDDHGVLDVVSSTTVIDLHDVCDVCYVLNGRDVLEVQYNYA